MAWDLNTVNVDSFSAALSRLTAFPCAMTVWVNPDSAAVAYGIAAQDDGTNTQSIGIDTTAAGLPRARINNGAGAQAATGAVAVTAGAYNLLGANFGSATSRDIFLNGANKSSNATSRTFPTGTNRLLAGNNPSANSFLGQIAEFAGWQGVSLSDAEHASLYIAPGVGLSPLYVQRASLAFYYRLHENGVLTDMLTGGSPLTKNGTPTVSTQPIIILPERRAATRAIQRAIGTRRE